MPHRPDPPVASNAAAAGSSSLRGRAHRPGGGGGRGGGGGQQGHRRQHHRHPRNNNQPRRQHRTHSTSIDPGADCHAAWLQALNDATACLRLHRSPRVEEIEDSVVYLLKLEELLRKKQSRWHRPPLKLPPKFETTPNNGRAVGAGAGLPHYAEARQDNSGTDGMGRNNLRNNQFASFIDEDNDDEGSDDDTEEDVDQDEAEGGDQPTMPGMDMRRLLIRILTYQADLYAAMATVFRKAQQWLQGAAQFEKALLKIRASLDLADSEISKWVQEGRNTDQLAPLAEDANIVQVAVYNLVAERDKYKALAKQHEGRLMRKLQPQWDARNEARRRMGEERWNNNPTPKNDHWEARREAEEQLKDVRACLECLYQLDTRQEEAATDTLQVKLHGQDADSARRYNGVRPSEELRATGVDPIAYPDPTIYGWRFTGSHEVTEFFEKDGVKLDWYFTTGTVKTALDHPTQGRTQLFANRVEPDLYIKILQNPRYHTGDRYHKRHHRPRQRQ